MKTLDASLKLVSFPGKATRRLYGPGEVGVFIAKQHRPVYEDGGVEANATNLGVDYS